MLFLHFTAHLAKQHFELALSTPRRIIYCLFPNQLTFAVNFLDRLLQVARHRACLYCMIDHSNVPLIHPVQIRFLVKPYHLAVPEPLQTACTVPYHTFNLVLSEVRQVAVHFA